MRPLPRLLAKQEAKAGGEGKSRPFHSVSCCFTIVTLWKDSGFALRGFKRYAKLH